MFLFKLKISLDIFAMKNIFLQMCFTALPFCLFTAFFFEGMSRVLIEAHSQITIDCSGI